MTRPDVVVLGWTEGHQRTATLADALGVQAQFMPWARHGLPPVRRALGWVRSAVRTVGLVRGAAPDALIIVQAPPVFAPLVTVLARRGRQKLVVDAHSGTFNDTRWTWAHSLQRSVLARFDLMVVTNRRVLEGTGTPSSLPVAVAHDVLVRRTSRPGTGIDADGQEPSRRVAVFPASGFPDEPFDAVRGAAQLLVEDGFEIAVTGRQRGLEPSPGLRPTGWLDTADYEDLLAGCVCVLALTTRENTMQRAAYEALERDLPVVCSDTAALREAFGEGAEYTPASAEGIADAVRRSALRAEEMVRAGRDTFARMSATTDQTLAALRELAPLRSTVRPDGAVIQEGVR